MHLYFVYIIDMIYKNISSLTILRKRKQLSQQSLAEKLNVTQVTISLWENGISYPTIPTIYKLAQILEEPAEVVFKSFPIKREA